MTGSAGWFAPVPAHRFATFRVLLALTTILAELSVRTGWVRSYAGSSFHAPRIEWVPGLPPSLATAFIASQHVAAWALLLGLAPRPAAGFLAASGFYLLAIERFFYLNSSYAHLLLLTIVAFSSAKLRFFPLSLAREPQPTAPAWPENLLRVQAAIIFFHTALDKVVSPHWGPGGTMLAAMTVPGHAPSFVEHGPPLSFVDEVARAAIRAAPGVFSVGVIATELALAAFFLFGKRAWSRFGAVLGFAFAAALELLLRPHTFAWHVATLCVLLLPAGDRAYTVVHDERRAACRRRRWLIERLDWLGRIRFEPRPGATLELFDPAGAVHAGARALGRLVLLLPGPILAALVVVRFAGFR